MRQSMSMFHEQLLMRALAALCEVADECPTKPAPKNLSLRFILAYTFVAAGAAPKLKWIWTAFWESATAPHDPMKPMDDYLRGTAARSALNGICREVGYPPDNALLASLRAHRKVRRRPRGEQSIPEHANDEPGDDDVA